MYIGPYTCMSGYVSAYHGVGKLCILLHTILCHAVKRSRAGTGFLAKTVYGTGTGTTFIITTEPVPVLQPFCRLPVPAL